MKMFPSAFPFRISLKRTISFFFFFYSIKVGEAVGALSADKGKWN